MSMIIHGVDDDVIKQEIYLIGFREYNGYYKVSNVECNYGFLRLIDMISNFITNNNLREKQKEIKVQYQKFKDIMNDAVLSASISYHDIKYSIDANVIHMHKLKEKINLTCWKGEEEIEIPQHAKYLAQFFNEYYDDIKNIFPIYNRLENIYRLCALNVIMDDFKIEQEIHESVYIDTYPRSILCSGGILLAPRKFIAIPPKVQPVANQVIEVCSIKRGLADAPAMIGSIHHAGIMVKTVSNEYHILEWGPSGAVLRKTNPNISGFNINEEGHKWKLDSCQSMKKDNYNPERIKELMDIIVYNEPYNLIANNCQDVQQKLLNALLQ